MFGNCPISHCHGTQHLEANAVIQQPTTTTKTNNDNKQQQRQSMKMKHTTNNATINLTTTNNKGISQSQICRSTTMNNDKKP